MKKLARNSFLVLFVFVQMASSATLTPEQKEAISFIQKMYSYGAGTFEFSEFKGKHEPDRQCLLVEEFFLKNLISRPEKIGGCKVGAGTYIRYPGAGSEELSENTRKGQMPRPKLSIPVVEGDKARIEAASKYGKTVFFLTKTDKGLRVENALYYEKIPTEVNVCHGQFLIDPTPTQLKYRPACKDY